MRTFKLEQLEKDLNDCFASYISKEDAINIGYKILKIAYKELLRQEVLTNHIAGNTTSFPMNFYNQTETIEVFTNDLEKDLVRKIYNYTCDDGTIIKVFEQNWFAGSGIYVEGKGYVGLLD